MTAVAVESTLTAKGEALLKDIEDSFILTRGGHSIRSIPTFRPEEISLGKVLGTGGFAIVQEIRRFTLDDSTELSSSGATASEGGNSAHQQDALADEVDKECRRCRKLMDQKVMRNGSSRYALKRLLATLDEKERARGMLDLALEAKYLAIVSHPGIIKIRGMSADPLISRDFFIVLDRLHDILDKRMLKWKEIEKSNKGYLLGIGKKARVLKALLISRMIVAYDLASALHYLHEHRIAYRDLKPENAGFDVRDDVKLFDFGLCTSLSSKRKAKDGYGYRLTGRAGSIPYMSPEVVKMETYDTKCDVFGFAILFWEILSLKQSFEGMGTSEFVESVVINKYREPIPKTFPPLTRLMLQQAWDDDPRKRPDMKRVASIIRQDLNDLTSDDSVRHRTSHMDDRSSHSAVRLDVGGGIVLTELPDYFKDGIGMSTDLDETAMSPCKSIDAEEIAMDPASESKT